MDATLSDPLVGRLVDGRYAVGSRIARGGMATVYLATDNRLDRDVALKVMHPHLADDDQFVARFHREAKSAARLSHPGVVAVYDQGSDGHAVYLAMELVPGSTLRGLLDRRGALTPREALDVLEPVLDALSAAHRAGIVHRDVKPENVLLTEDGRVKVADFGLARAASTSRTSTTTGMLIGTVAYLSPELVLRGVADARSDVYAAGILLFEMLTGRQPFTGDVPIQVAYQHVNDDVPPPSTLDPDLPEALDDLVLSATARDPDDRPSDAASLLQELRQVRAHLTAEQLDRAAAPRAPHADEAPSPAPGATLALRRRAGGLALPVGEREGDDAGGDHDPAGPHTDDPDAVDWGYGPGGRRRRRGLLALLAVLLLAVAAGTTAWFLTAGPGAYTTAPDVVGQPVETARTALTAAGLEGEQLPRYSDTVPAEHVIDTRPGPGGEVRKGGSVQLFVSQGPELLAVPKLVGSTRDEALAALQAQELTVGEVTAAFDEKVPEGVVVSQSVAAGEKLRRTDPIALVVSKGREPIPVPSVVGSARAEAVTALEAAALEAKVTGEFSVTVPEGVVISQSPADGTLFRGDPVTVVVSKGPPLVAVPDVVGLQVGEATTLLEGAGFTVAVEKVLGGYFGTVRSQDPAAGAKVPRGSTVTVTIV